MAIALKKGKFAAMRARKATACLESRQPRRATSETISFF
jgi:hypothetical protein